MCRDSVSPPPRGERGFDILGTASQASKAQDLRSCSLPGFLPPIQQVTDERTCMQFSIRRPKLPSSETHPEESLYRRLDVSAWLNHLNDLGQVEEEYKLRQVQCTAGSPGQPPGSPGSQAAGREGGREER